MVDITTGNVARRDDHEPDYKAAMLYHSDRADAYMVERDALSARLAEVEADPIAPSEQRAKYDSLRARVLAGKASQQEAADAIDKLCQDNERLAVSAGRQRSRAEAAEDENAKLTEALEGISIAGGNAEWCRLTARAAIQEKDQ